MVQNFLIPSSTSFIVSTGAGLIEPGRRPISKLLFHALFAGLYYLTIRPSKTQAIASTASSVLGYYAGVVLIVKLFGIRH